MGFKEFREQRLTEKERIKAEDRLYEARNELVNIYVQAAREIVEYNGYQFTEMSKNLFRNLMLAAIDAGYEPDAIEKIVNGASKALGNAKNLSEITGGEYFVLLVKNDLERGFQLDVLQQ